MNQRNFNITIHKPRILVAPLEWGLGHATRCIPIIHALIAQNCTVLLAAGAGQAALLKQEFPSLEIIPLKGYRMQYSRKKKWFALKLLLQFPKMALSIYNERRWLKRVITTHNIDAVISDNRFGLSHPLVPCIYITHQLNIKTGNKLTDSIARNIHYNFINRYSACWVPDNPGTYNLAGELSHPQHLPKIPVSYLGPISRFEKMEVEKKYDILLLLSGPEPQRSIFENLLIHEFKDYNGKIVLVRGLPETANKISIPPGMEVHHHLPANKLNQLIQESNLVICRSGYTSIMDLVKLGQPAVLVPTPGQKEQEYLALYMRQNNLFYSVEQADFNFTKIAGELKQHRFEPLLVNQENFKEKLEELVESLKSKQT